MSDPLTKAIDRIAEQAEWQDGTGYNIVGMDKQLEGVGMLNDDPTGGVLRIIDGLQDERDKIDELLRK